MKSDVIGNCFYLRVSRNQGAKLDRPQFFQRMVQDFALFFRLVVLLSLSTWYSPSRTNCNRGRLAYAHILGEDMFLALSR